MITSLEQANKNIDKSKQYYERYIRQMVGIYKNDELCRMIKEYEIKRGVEVKSLDPGRSRISKALNRGSVMGLYRLANLIDETIKDNA